jgi:hypothetical protein
MKKIQNKGLPAANPYNVIEKMVNFIIEIVGANLCVRPNR